MESVLYAEFQIIQISHAQCMHEIGHPRNIKGGIGSVDRVFENVARVTRFTNEIGNEHH
jgi:hypothetical protein